MPTGAELTEEQEALFKQMQDGKGEKEAPKEEKPAPEQKAEKPEEKPESKVEEKKSPLVPKAALDEARAENKDLRKELDSMKSLLAEGDKKLQRLVEQIEKKADAGPKFEDDPAAHLKHENDQLRKGLAELQDKIAKQEEAGQQNAKVNEHAAAVTAREKAFAKEHTDYYKAAEYVAEVWRDEFREAGFDEADIPKLVFGKSLTITGKALQAGRDPASVIYNLAKRSGFAAPQKEAPKKEDGEAKLKSIEKGLEAAKGNKGGDGPDEDGGLAGLAQLSDDDLEKRVQDKDWWAKNIRRSALH